MITIHQNKSQSPFNVLPKSSSTAHFNPPDWRKTCADEAYDLTEDVLISAAQAGQEWAFVELCFCHSKRILFILNKITKNREDAEDAFQESILKACILGISIDLRPLLHGSHGLVSIRRSRFSAGSALGRRSPLTRQSMRA